MLGGFLKQMNDTLQYNRDLLGKRKSARELYKEEIKSRTSTYDHVVLEQVRERVAKKLRRNHTEEILARVVAVVLLGGVVTGLIWTVSFISAGRKIKNETPVVNEFFTTIDYKQSDGRILRSEHYPSGARAAETFFKHGLRHQNSESYYESGEQFRSALYYHDTLVTEVFLFKSGDTITNFPPVDERKIMIVNLTDAKRRKRIKFRMFDNKIVPGSYTEVPF
jgi:hypothetical protein